MDKIKILGSKKSDNHNLFILDKKQEFFSGFRKFLVDMDFGSEDSSFDIYSFGRPQDEEHEPIIAREEKINEYIDQDFTFTHKGYTINVIFGKNKIFLIIFSKKNIQEKVAKAINKFCIF
jgi:hypothetical protein